MFKLRFQSFAFILSLLILAGFFGYLRAWTGPTSSPPGSNAPSPVNIGTSDQEKAGRLSATEFYDADNSSFYINPSGDSKVSGTLSLGGDLYDVTNSKKIYDSATGKFDPTVMPYEKGDLTSDWSTNTNTSSYYDVSNLTSGNVKESVTFGRGSTGSLPVVTCAEGTATVGDIKSGQTADIDCDGTAETGSLSLSGTASPEDVRDGKTFYGSTWTKETGTANIWTCTYWWEEIASTSCGRLFGSAGPCNHANVGQQGYNYMASTPPPATSQIYGECSGTRDGCYQYRCMEACY